MQADQGKAERIQKAQEGREYWLEKAKLGVLEAVIDDMLGDGSKRRRAACFRDAVRALKGLRLIPKDADVVRLSVGCNTLGDIGLMISCQIPSTLQTPIPGNYAAERRGDA